MAEVDGGFTPLSIGVYEDEINQKRVPPGEYDVRLAKWEFTESNRKGTPGIYFELRIINADDPAWNNWILHHRAWWTGTAWGIKDALLGLGGPEMSGTTLIPEEVRDGTSEEMNALIGEEGRVLVQEEDYEGKTSSKVARFIHRRR